VKVYIVTTGELRSGGSVCRVKTTLVGAQKAATEIVDCYNSGCPEDKMHTTESGTYWLNDVDYVAINEHEVGE
jgi:hypothetical protein